MQRFRPRLTYANVIATLALFIALGGVGYAATQLPKNSVGPKQLKRNAVTAAKIKNGAVTGAKVQLGSLGVVPNAAHAGTADRASTAGSVDSLPKLEPVRIAALENGCVNTNVSLFGPAGYYKDGFGIVHLTGQLENCTKNDDAFKLPPGFRPSVAIIHAVPGSEFNSEVEVLATGEVRPFATTNPSLGGITFRTD
jgi:hypothetical protein